MNRAIQIFFAAAFAFVLAGCAGTDARVVSSTGNAPSISQAQQVPADGPQYRVAVSSFEMLAGPNIGGALADFLIDSLFNSGRFIVLERARLDAVLAEQALQATPDFQSSTVVPTGGLEGAELLVRGAVVAFEPSCRGTSLLIFGAGTACITLNLRIIDVATGRILNATTVEVSSGSSQVGFFFARGALPVGLGTYNRTPMETAMRIAIETAVRHIVDVRI